MALAARLRGLIVAANDTTAAPPVVRTRATAAPTPRRWTVPRLLQWVTTTTGRVIGRETLRQALHAQGLSYKKGKKLLARAKPAARAAFLARMRAVLAASWAADEVIVYVDEAHIHQDADLGYGWAPRGARLWVNTRSPGLSKRVTFYGAYVWTTRRVHIWSFPRANTDHTATVLRRLRARYPGRPLRVIWDGASYHRSRRLRTLAATLGITLEPLPAYSPDLMPVEALWRWLREEVTQNCCHDECAALVARVRAFARAINRYPLDLFARLQTPTELHPAIEKLRLSTG